jgi:FkbM family methyltransferase
MMDRARSSVRQVARPLGVEEPLRRAWSRLGPRTARRDGRDNRHLAMLLAFTLSPDSNCVDVGSHVGAVLGEVVRLAPDGRHVAFEPLPELADHLRRAYPGVDVRRAALSDRAGEADFVRVVDSPAYSGFRQRPWEEGRETERLTVPVETLDGALPAGYVPTLIKIDVEGSERMVIEGGLETIATHRPVVVFEYGRLGIESYGTAPRDIFALLCTRAGLRLYDLDGAGPFSAREFDRVVARGRRWNFVARP